VFNNWHFIDKPYNPDGILHTTGYSENVVWAIQQALGTLQKNNPNYKNAILETSIAMRLLLHLVGDYHQPLHVATL
jgi:hypothetical protein